MREQDLQSALLQAARLSGWLTYHTRDSRGSDKGFPDLTLCHPGRGLLVFAELKTEKGRVTVDQMIWLQSLARTIPFVYLWRPEHYDAALRFLVDGLDSPELEASRIPSKEQP